MKNISKTLNLQPIKPQELGNFDNVMKISTLPKIRADIKRNNHNLIVAKQKMAY